MVKFFIDFDGTITTRDVGDALLERFGGAQCTDFIREYHEERLTAFQCFEKESQACGAVDRIELDRFIDAQEIDSTFPEFIDYCTAQGFEMSILSDGMDYYINRILERFGIQNVPVYTNTLTLEQVGQNGHVRFVPSFPYTDELCDRCASCKRNHMLTLSGESDLLLYIGEGYSDRCPVRYADVVFAKDDLLDYCRREEIPHVRYETFADIVRYVDRMTRKNGRTKVRMRKRRQAELARREVFLGG